VKKDRTNRSVYELKIKEIKEMRNEIKRRQ
jgi:hypothetical protein